jgi:hypothetical protein
MAKKIQGMIPGSIWGRFTRKPEAEDLFLQYCPLNMILERAEELEFLRDKLSKLLIM